MLPKDRNIHRPPHIYAEEEIYFISNRTPKNNNYLNDDFRKRIFTKVFNNLIKKLDIKVFAWVLLSNHYHLLVKFHKNKEIARFTNRLDSIVTLKINQLDNTPGRRVWYQYFDKCVYNEVSFFKFFNYIHYNPIKHGYVNKLKELFKYKFSSYNKWVEKRGREWVLESFWQYPLDDFIVKNIE